ncbi:hypothetical protein HW555_009738 [Spodoptera exigua]|uniref:Uncharacterized protein n=1 Tax=Spodoptera exigua TaxID=7107 RepID=A0A835GCH8_SPOEX|nr:hypothetical protein HW555_009738 [Spodoptera exigua]
MLSYICSTEQKYIELMVIVLKTFLTASFIIIIKNIHESPYLNFGPSVQTTKLGQQFVRTAVPNVIHNVDVLYYGQPPRVIKAAVIQTFPTASWIFPVWHLDNYISIRISSQKGHGMNGTVQIYGTLEEIYKPAIPGVVQTVVVSHRAKPGTWISRSIAPLKVNKSVHDKISIENVHCLDNTKIESYYVPAVPDTIQRLDVVYRGNSTTYISQVRIEEPRPNVNFNFSPLGNTYMQVRLASAVGMPIQLLRLLEEIF